MHTDHTRRPITTVYSSKRVFLRKVGPFGGLDDHRRAVAQPCVNGDRLSQGRMAKFDPAQTRNPWTDRHKIWNRWLRRRDDPHAKFRANSSIGGFSANRWNI